MSYHFILCFSVTRHAVAGIESQALCIKNPPNNPELNSNRHRNIQALQRADPYSLQFAVTRVDGSLQSS